MRGQVVKLDRGYPLVRCQTGRLVRCEHATALVKTAYSRAVIGDFVDVSIPEGHDKGIIEDIEPRAREFVRKDPTERALPQVLAANFDRVLVAQPLADRLIGLGVRGFWNFTNVELSTKEDGVFFEDIHFVDTLLTLSYRISQP